MPSIGMVDAGIIQPLRTIDITMPTHQETLLGTPEALPTTEPGTSQISYTIQASDLPVLSGGTTCKYTALIVAAGKNTDASSQTVSYRVLKNSTSVATATSAAVATNNFWTHTHSRFYDVAVGDVLECRLWASDTDVNWDYKALFIYPTRISFAKTNSIITNAEYTVSQWPTLTLGAPTVVFNNTFVPYHSDFALTAISALTKYKVQVLGATSLSGKIAYGDNSAASTDTRTSATNRPSYVRNYVSTKITFNPTPIIV